VQQGQVERLIAQGEEGFLRMLKEVTGTESFDSRVEKMTAVLGECAGKREQMEKILAKIKERLGELGKEIEEYREIQKVERDKRALEMALYSRR
jgi:chromosome segregation ATPase